MVHKQPRYVTSLNNPLPISAEMRSFLLRRISPFLDGVGMAKPLNHLMIEAYLQGLRDATEILGGTPDDQ